MRDFHLSCKKSKKYRYVLNLIFSFGVMIQTTNPEQSPNTDVGVVECGVAWAGRVQNRFNPSSEQNCKLGIFLTNISTHCGNFKTMSCDFSIY